MQLSCLQNARSLGLSVLIDQISWILDELFWLKRLFMEALAADNSHCLLCRSASYVQASD